MTPIQNNLRQLRKQKGLTQWQVARLLGLHSIDRISKWEKGTMYPHIRNAIRLSAIYRVSVEELFAPEENSILD